MLVGAHTILRVDAKAKNLHSCVFQHDVVADPAATTTVCWLLTAGCWAHLCVVVWDLAEQVVGHVRVSNAVEEDVQDAVAAGDCNK
jgi:hypothetical protein